ncbi:MAG: hypothetical protein AUJ92_17550 [Armatimonadetes bacterium CG2_30_59_28]|nr:SpoIIE family protein phosphatase [Armatimonadota bacterium]OIO90936.1 MAG: hypothetical protein AUJ92_17550 [Armatimonadetes bacterium CG2_30_59_28]PIU66934.1 MAG: hypothetical protein COS85_02695 [Armatimonadetes bacterium CG07_land_8_20_14_0_80_59_28]PIX40113.1 MAG: hypothetical protein COZ56_15570 [Armatimonadetes bacterium CG_4_8_14_3_um_filter_58_9]PJB75959.1 MAG: hypothetical protein CO095_03130 [Armatimonadetes bacterium CG_4_9_14_3_um_filter_58_7]
MRILVVDDDEKAQKVLERALQIWGHEVTVADDGVDAWAKLQADPADLVITDWMMPNMDGIELCRHIRDAHLPHYVFAILLTAKTEREDLMAAMEAGADDFIPKPYDLSELNARLRAVERIVHAKAETDRHIRNMNALLAVSEALGSEIQLDKLLQIILDRTTEVMDAERSSLFLYDETTNELWSKIAQDLEIQEIRIPLGTGVAGDVAQTRTWANIPDAYDDDRFNPSFDKSTGFRTKAILCVPMITNRNKLIGVIQVLNKGDGGVFTTEDELLLAALASHAAVALERAKLVEDHIQKQRIEESLRLARDIQTSTLPMRFPPFPHRNDFDIYATSRPAVEVGGDFYDFFLVDEEHLGFVLGDVSGKGVPAALLMARTSALIRATASRELSASGILTWVNNQIAPDNDSCMFVTLVVGILETRTGIIRYTNGGHNPPYILRQDRTVETLDDVHGLPLGVMESFDYEEGEVLLKPGDTLLIYSDGVTEAMNTEGKEFTSRRLESELAQAMGYPVDKILTGIVEEVNRFTEGAPQADDITTLALQYHGGNQR